MRVKLFVRNDRPIPRIGDTIWCNMGDYKVWGKVKSIESVVRDDRMRISIIYRVKVINRDYIGLKVVEGAEHE
ncbi:hypothetical protein JNUCC1_03334 [Lentibacillus sp. JNUCC-1]|nr:hypothetical protein [Lentibacillus sp. JNUCC-1]